MNKMSINIDKNGKVYTSINGKRLPEIGKNHLGLVKQDAVGIPLADAHPMIHFTVCEEIDDDGIVQGDIPYCIHKLNDREAEASFIFAKHSACWRESMGLAMYIEAARAIVHKKAASLKVGVLPNVFDDDDYVGTAFRIIFQGSTIDDVIKQADDLVVEIMNELDQFSNKVEADIQSQLSRI